MGRSQADSGTHTDTQYTTKTNTSIGNRSNTVKGKRNTLIVNEGFTDASLQSLLSSLSMSPVLHLPVTPPYSAQPVITASAQPIPASHGGDLNGLLMVAIIGVVVILIATRRN